MALYKAKTGGEIGPKAIQRARALALLGLNPLDPTIAELWDDFLLAASGSAVTNWFSSRAGSGTSVMQVAGAGGGVFRSTTGATANSRDDWHSLTGAIANVSTAKWYLSFRDRFITTPDGQTVLGIGLVNIAFTKTIIAGLNGTLDAAHYTLQYDGNFGAGSTISLVAAPDLNVFRTIEIYGKGDAKVYVTFDGGPELSATMSAAAADSMYPIIATRNGTTAAAQSQEPDWVYGLFRRI